MSEKSKRRLDIKAILRDNGLRKELVKLASEFIKKVESYSNMARESIHTNLLGKTALKNVDYPANCWPLPGVQAAEIVAVWLDADKSLKVALIDNNGNTGEAWLNHIKVKV